MSENNKNIIRGKDLDAPVPKITFGKMIYDHLLSSPLKVEVMVDALTGQKISTQRLLTESCNLAEALRVAGYSTNTVLAVISENSLQYFISVFASFFNRSIVSLVNPMYTPPELKHCLNITKPKIIFSSCKCLQKVFELRKELKFIEKIIVIDSAKLVEGATSLNDFIEISLRGRSIGPYNFQPMVFDPVKTAALVLYSSGTTGLSKGVSLSHYSLVLSQSIAWKTEFDPNNPQTAIAFSPFYHSMGFNASLYSIINCRRLIVMSRFDEDLFLKAIQDYKVQVLSLPPPVMVLLAKSPKVKNYDLSSLQMVGFGAAAIHKNVEEAFTKRFNLSSISQGYGMTEATLGVIILPPGVNKPGSCGFVVPLISCIVRDPETGQTLGPNQPGELCFKGPLIMLGYYNDEKATKKAFTEDGWLRSGDIGYYDEDQFFYIVDRLKELIKYKGFQVAPAELEGLLLGHPYIDDAAVVGRPDEVSGELPTAFVVKKDSSNVTEKEIQKYVRGLVSPHKRLTGGVIFVSQIPKTSTGKILRRELRQEVAKYTSKSNSRSKL